MRVNETEQELAREQRTKKRRHSKHRRSEYEMAEVALVNAQPSLDVLPVAAAVYQCLPTSLPSVVAAGGVAAAVVVAVVYIRSM